MKADEVSSLPSKDFIEATLPRRFADSEQHVSNILFEACKSDVSSILLEFLLEAQIDMSVMHSNTDEMNHSH